MIFYQTIELNQMKVLIMSVNKTRKSNFELLRIISMFMILILHIGTHGLQKHANIKADFSDTNEWVYYFFRSLSIIAVSIYVLLSGYFLSKSKSKFQFSKLVKLFLETSFFSLIIYFALIVTNYSRFNLADFKISTFSIIFNEYWFITVYFVLYILYPFLNKMLLNITKREHAYLLIMLFFIINVWDFLLPLRDLGISNGYSLLYFIFLYIFAAYISYYGFLVKELNKYIYLIIYFLLAILNASLVYYDVKFLNAGWYSYNSPIILLMAYSLFMFFKQLNINLRIINFTSYYVLGVYLIHEQHNFRNVLWGDFSIIEKILSVSSDLILLSLLGYCLIIFVICLLISMIIKFIFDNLYKVLELLVSKIRRTNIKNN